MVGVTEGADGPHLFGLDTRHARRRLTGAVGEPRLLIPRAYALDDLTIGLLWAVANLDEPLLDDDVILTASREYLDAYEGLPRSVAGQEIGGELAPVSQMWLGSDFCARHILRHADTLDDVPTFWTREQRGEEASTWLLFAHKYAYLRESVATFTGTEVCLTRAFCIPQCTVSMSSRPERILLLLAMALMESFGVRVDVCDEPEYTAVQGFVLDQRRRAIVANWVGADRIWHVDVTDTSARIREFADATGYARAHSVVAAPTPAGRLRALADHLGLDWSWLVHRCQELADYGCAGIAQPRSRLLSVAGVDRACHFLNQPHEMAHY